MTAFLSSLSCRSAFIHAFFLCVTVGTAAVVHAACGEIISPTMQELVAEEHALQDTEQAVRTNRTRMQGLEAQLQDLLAHPPDAYNQDLARRVAALRRTEVEPKRRTLENLRVQHEESRQKWERGHRLLSPQLAEAQTAFQAKTMTREDFCRVRETYQQALKLYLQGMRNYRQGMNLYARALSEYADRFLTPYLAGFTDSRQWETLFTQLKRGDFLHDILVPMTANAIRSVPPGAPPE